MVQKEIFRTISVIFMTYPVILRTNPDIFRTNAVTFYTNFDRNFETDGNGQKQTEMDRN